ncbi:hypothetical protein C7H09_08195 [Marinobacter fuscus]|uniref:Uncharacterized protein n=1 Tax=Marinobacter fuscus TaxID=2109942 RepID=A0A2T1KFT8_9GAMM|nr:hypothetical protein C7H09_08195 [Marinobacter fuscus]
MTLPCSLALTVTAYSITCTSLCRYDVFETTANLAVDEPELKGIRSGINCRRTAQHAEHQFCYQRHWRLKRPNRTRTLLALVLTN